MALRLGVMPDEVRRMDPIDAGALVALLMEQTERDALRREFDG